METEHGAGIFSAAPCFYMIYMAADSVRLPLLS